MNWVIVFTSCFGISSCDLPDVTRDDQVYPVYSKAFDAINGSIKNFRAVNPGRTVQCVSVMEYSKWEEGRPWTAVRDEVCPRLIANPDQK